MREGLYVKHKTENGHFWKMLSGKGLKFWLQNWRNGEPGKFKGCGMKNTSFENCRVVELPSHHLVT